MLLCWIANRQHTCFSPNSPGFDSLHSQKNFWWKIIDVADVNQQHWLDENGKWLENVDLASGKPVLQKVILCPMELTMSWSPCISISFLDEVDYSFFLCWDSNPVPSEARIHGLQAKLVSLGREFPVRFRLNLGYFLEGPKCEQVTQLHTNALSSL